MTVMMAVCAGMVMGAEAPGEAPAEQKETVKAVTVEVGQATRVNLKSNPTTGYLWVVDTPTEPGDPVMVELLMGGAECNDMMCGAPVTTTACFVGLSPGTKRVVLVYKRPWERDKEPAKKAIFDVTVKYAEAK